MRTMMRVEIPVEAGNEGIRNGTLAETMERTFERIHPESTYFTTHDGKRAAYVVFDLSDPAEIPSIAEPFFMNLNASVEFLPCMNREDLEAGLNKLA